MGGSRGGGGVVGEPRNMGFRDRVFSKIRSSACRLESRLQAPVSLLHTLM